jgi:pimeloyl-[acyl-carrier protein] synthase
VKREDEAWVATSHAAVSTVLRAPGWSSDHRRATIELPEIAGSLLSKVLLFMDAPDHTRVRALVSRAFHPRTIDQLRPRMAALTDELLAPLQAAGGFDVIDEFAFPLPVTVICELLGVPSEDRDLLRGFTREMAVILDLDATPAQLGGAIGASLAFTAYLVPLFEERRRHPRDDLISALVAAEEAGDRLGTDELLTTVILLLVAGHETTMNLIGNGLLALLRHPAELARLRADAGLVPGAVEELLRYDPPVRMTVRTCVADTVLDGVRVRAGEQVVARLDAANHDPAVFAAPPPDVLDVRRADAHRHVAFGAGPHFCLGAALARAEAQVAFAALVRLPGLALAVDEPEWRPLATFHALRSLPVRVSVGQKMPAPAAFIT